MSPRERLTITLTDRPPVTVTTAYWPVVAEASESWHDNQYEFQANRRTKWRLVVRQHADGPAVVYAVYEHDTQFQGERGVDRRGGELLEVKDGKAPDLPAAIRRVGEALAERIGGEDGDRMRELIHECVASLPAETID